MIPHELTRTEAIVTLANMGRNADERQLRALLKACKALGKEVAHKAAYNRNLTARGKQPALEQPVAEAALANPPFGPPEPEPSAEAPAE